MTAAHIVAADQRPSVVAPTPRLAWLDGLRGFAALTVVGFHLTPLVLGNDRHLAIMRQLDFGKYGVLLFFLVSGYVVPMSLERHGSLRRFWIGRLCRIYPAYLATIAGYWLCVLGGWLDWQSSLLADPLTGVLAHATMLADPLGLRGAVRVFWTLSYEMLFYLVVAGLFAWRLHRHSAWWATGLALVALFVGARLPNGFFAETPSGRRSVAIILAVMLTFVVVAQVAGRFVHLAGLVGLAFLGLAAANGHPNRNSTVIASWQGLLFLAVMFAGTVLYRAQHGQLRRRTAVFALSVVAVSLVGAHGSITGQWHAWAATVLAVAVTFGGAYALRHRTVPGILSWFGQISFSLYLLHALVLLLVQRAVPDFANLGGRQRVELGLGYLVVAFAVAWLAWRFVEIPGQALARRLTNGPAPTKSDSPPKVFRQPPRVPSPTQPAS